MKDCRLQLSRSRQRSRRSLSRWLNSWDSNASSMLHELQETVHEYADIGHRRIWAIAGYWPSQDMGFPACAARDSMQLTQNASSVAHALCKHSSWQDQFARNHAFGLIESGVQGLDHKTLFTCSVRRLVKKGNPLDLVPHMLRSTDLGLERCDAQWTLRVLFVIRALSTANAQSLH